MNTRHPPLRLWAPLIGLSLLFTAACGADGTASGAPGTALTAAPGTAATAAGTASADGTAEATAEVDSAGTLIAPEEVDPADLSIVLTPSSMLAAGKDIDSEDLLELMTSHAKSVENAKVTIYADKTLDHGIVVKVIDTAKRAGIYRYSVAKTTP